MEVDRITRLRRTLTTPGWRRNLLLRRTLALVLLAAAGTAALRSALASDPGVVVFARDLTAGQAVTTGDVEVRPVPPDLIPAGALTSPSELEGRVVVAAAAAGEVATESRFIGAAVTAQLLGETGEPTTMVPLKLAEPELLPLLHHGDTVTIVTHVPDSAEPQVVAAGARVVLAAGEADGTGSGSAGTVLVALPETEARAVAATALGAPLAVVLTGARATGGVLTTPGS